MWSAFICLFIWFANITFFKIIDNHFVCSKLRILRRNRYGRRKMDGSLLFTTGPTVATIPDCIRVTMVLPDIFGLASSQRTQLNVHTCTRAHTEMQQETPALSERSFPAWLGAESLEDLLPLSTYFLAVSLNFPLARCSSFYTYCGCVLETCGIPSLSRL